jgi:hypothetical protein
MHHVDDYSVLYSVQFSVSLWQYIQSEEMHFNENGICQVLSAYVASIHGHLFLMIIGIPSRSPFQGQTMLPHFQSPPLYQESIGKQEQL